MIINPNPVMAVYECDTHCIPCAEQRFGQTLYDANGATDAFDEQVSLIHAWEFEPQSSGEYCGTCSEVIAEPDDDYDPEGE